MSDVTPQNLAQFVPWGEGSDPIWPASLFILRRNFAHAHFPPKLDEKEAQSLSHLIKEAFLHSRILEEPQFYPSTDLSPSDRELIFEHFLTFDPTRQVSKGQALIMEKSASCLALINATDHLVLRWACTQESWHMTWKKLGELHQELALKIPFAYSSRFGYLTSQFRHAGTGLTARAILHLPALIHSARLDALQAEMREQGILFKGLERSAKEFTGDLILLQNRHQLGVSEEDILKNVYASAKRLSQLEREERQKIQTQPSAQLKDKVSRAFGLLSHSYELHAKETLDALSLLKLGIHLGWVKEISDTEVFRLMFLTRRSHLMHVEQLALSSEELPHKRSEFLHKKLERAKLLV